MIRASPISFAWLPHSDDKLIQQINPANGEVIAEFPASEFAELARSVGISGALVDSTSKRRSGQFWYAACLSLLTELPIN